MTRLKTNRFHAKPVPKILEALPLKKPKDDLFRPHTLDDGITHYFQQELKSGKKVLVLFAVGGGNDNFSVIHLAQYLKELGFEVLIFSAAGFVKATIDQELHKRGLSSDQLLLLMSDYGGDVLGHDLSTYSPDLDSLSARMIDALDYPFVKKLAVIFWPGVDGELSQSTLLKRFAELKGALIAQSEVNDKSSYFQTLKDIYTKIEPFRTGNTIPNAINMLSRSGRGILSKTLSSRKGYTVEEKWELDINEELVRSTLLLPLSSIIAINPFAQIKHHDDLFDLFIRIMNIYDEIEQAQGTDDAYKAQKRTDLHMQYLTLDRDGFWTSKHPTGITMQLLIPPASYTQAQCDLLLKGGFENLKDGTIDIALVYYCSDFQQKFDFDKENTGLTIVNNYMLFWDKRNPENTREVEKLKARLIELTKPNSSKKTASPDRFFPSMKQEAIPTESLKTISLDNTTRIIGKF